MQQLFPISNNFLLNLSATPISETTKISSIIKSQSICPELYKLTKNESYDMRSAAIKGHYTENGKLTIVGCMKDITVTVLKYDAKRT